MTARPGFKNEALGAALEDAVRGAPRKLYDLLTRVSGLPGPRPNLGVALAFANECATRGALADALVSEMASLDADRTPGDTELEILPMCGVLALGARGATDDRALRRSLSKLHDLADDLRFRVREAVPMALARIGEARGDALVPELAPWMDGFFHATAVLLALGMPDFFNKLHDPGPVVQRLEDAFTLAKDAPRAAARYPGYKALLEALSTVPNALALRFGVPVFDALVRFSTVKDPPLRATIEKSVAGARLLGRFADEVLRVQKALDATAPVLRDPTHYKGPTRKRGKRGARTR